MKNLILKHGDSVRVLRLNAVFERCGLKVGAWYVVTTDVHGRLSIASQGQGAVTLTAIDGTLDGVTDDITLRGAPPKGLPRGQGTGAASQVAKSQDVEPCESIGPDGQETFSK